MRGNGFPLITKYSALPIIKKLLHFREYLVLPLRAAGFALPSSSFAQVLIHEPDTRQT